MGIYHLKKKCPRCKQHIVKIIKFPSRSPHKGIKLIDLLCECYPKPYWEVKKLPRSQRKAKKDWKPASIKDVEMLVEQWENSNIGRVKIAIEKRLKDMGLYYLLEAKKKVQK